MPYKQSENKTTKLFCLDISIMMLTRKRVIRLQELTPNSHFRNID